MSRQKASKSEWLTWEGDDFPHTFHSDSVVFYIPGHFDLETDQELRKDLARTIQREGICSSLGESFRMIDDASITLAGFCAEDLDLDLPSYCDLEDDSYDWDATFVEVPYVF
jgi:hypothetical protein